MFLGLYLSRYDLGRDNLQLICRQYLSPSDAEDSREVHSVYWEITTSIEHKNVNGPFNIGFSICTSAPTGQPGSTCGSFCLQYLCPVDAAHP